LVNDESFIEKLKDVLKAKEDDKTDLENLEKSLVKMKVDKQTFLIKVSLHRSYYYERFFGKINR